MGITDTLLNPVFGPLLALGPFWAIVIISLLISLLITVIYKFTTDQKLMKILKEELKAFQNEMKLLKDDPQKMMEIQKKAMAKNFEYMKHSFKPTLITFIPIIFIFGWLAAHFAYEPIYPGEEYTITATLGNQTEGMVELIPDETTIIIGERIQPVTPTVTWKLQSQEGSHFLQIKQGEQTVSKKVLITKELQYEEKQTSFPHSTISAVTINYRPLKPLGDLSFFGWRPEWLGIYILTSIVFSLVLRKVFKLH